MSDLRSLILSTDDIERTTVKVPQWDVEVGVRSMSAAERVSVFRRAQDEDGNLDMPQLVVLLVAECTFDPATGEDVFSPDDVEALANKNGDALQIIASEALRLAGVGQKDSDALPPSSESTPDTTEN